jgi:hypothetical protein
MRYKTDIPANLIPAAAGSQIHVYEAGTTNHLTQAIYADPTTTTPLANPYSHPGGKVSFYVAQPTRMSVGVQSAGAAAPVIAPVVTAATRQWSYSVMRIGGRPSDWVLS